MTKGGHFNWFYFFSNKRGNYYNRENPLNFEKNIEEELLNKEQKQAPMKKY